MGIKRILLRIILIGAPSIFFSLVPGALFSQEAQSNDNFDSYYYVDEHEIRTYRTANLLILTDPCDAPFGQSCFPLNQTNPVAVLPASVEGDLQDIYLGRKDYTSPNYPAQEFILTIGFLTLSNQSDRLVSLEQDSQRIVITIESDQDSHQQQNRIFLAKIIQVDLGYLEPGEYRFEVYYNRKVDGVLDGTYMEEPVFLDVLESDPV